MPIVSEAAVSAALRSGRPASVYLLLGDDEVGKGPLIEQLGALVEGDLQAFNVERLFANEGRLEDVIGGLVGAARTLPLLGDRRVVIALRCEVFLKPKRRGPAEDEEGSDGGDDVEPEVSTGATAPLERYLSAPSPETALVLVAADMARNTRLAKQLLKVATVVEYWGLKSDREAKGREVAQALHAAAEYVAARVQDAGLRIRGEAVTPLLEHAGTDIAVLRNDVDRLITYCLGRPEITAEDVRMLVAGAVQVDDWALTRAVQERDLRQALRQLQLALDAGHSPWMILGQLAWFVRARLGESQPGRVEPAIDAVFRADTALKSSGGDPQVLLERLVVELCGGEARGAAGYRTWRRA
jgi:DNA polymerase-3 subunit delta